MIDDYYGQQQEQGRAAAYDLGKLAASYYKALTDAGVPDPQAGQITAAYVAASSRRPGRSE